MWGKIGVVVHTCNLSTQKGSRSRKMGVHSCFQLYSEFRAICSTIWPCIKTKQTKKTFGNILTF